MARRPSASPAVTPAGPTACSRVSAALETIAFLALLLVVAMRPLIAETYDSATPAIVEAASTAAPEVPSTTAWFDSLIWLATLTAAVAGGLAGRRWQWTALAPGFGVLIVAAVVSTLSAGNQRLAINASVDWLTGLMLLIALANLLRSRWRTWLLLSVITASGLAAAAKCVMFVTVEAAETRDYYESNKAEFWSKQGVAPDDPRIELYEGRLNAGEASGFLAHSNTQGAGLALAGFAALTLGSLARRGSRVRLIALMLGAVLMVSVLTTGSRGAIGGSIVALLLWLILRRMPVPRVRWPVVLAGAWGVVLVGVGVVILYARASGGLPTDSLRFRWNYWEVSSRIVAEHPVTGVGARNFDRAYLKHKPVEYPEEIKDPHNFLVAIVAQWGTLGLLGLAMILAGGSAQLARKWSGREPDEGSRAAPQDADRRAAVRLVGAMIVLFLAQRFVLVSASAGPGPEGAAYVQLDLGLYGLLWCGAFAVLVLLMREGWASSRRFELACLCGAAAFMLHNTIDFGLFVPGTMTPFMALGAVLLARSGEPVAGVGVLPRAFPSVLTGAGLIAVLGLVMVPTSRVERRLSDAREATRAMAAMPTGSPAFLQMARQAEMAYQAAASADPLDPTPHVERATWLARWRDPDRLAAALHALDEAGSRDPDQVGIYRLRARIAAERHALTRRFEDLEMAMAASREALRCYPESPDDHVVAGDLLSLAAASGAGGGADHDASVRHASGYAAQAAWHYQHALELDARRSDGEIRRWSPSRREAVATRLRAMLAEQYARPATSPGP